MRAVVQRGYGNPREVLEFQDLDRPEPGDHEVLVRVQASSVNPVDWMQTVGRPYIVFRRRLSLRGLPPVRRVLGKDVAGTVEAIGPKVIGWRPGDEVFGELRRGAYAEYAVAGQDVLAPKPASLGFPEAAAVPRAGVAALQGIRQANVQVGRRVLINGASGGVGTFAVQLAKARGAHVTGVCSTRSIDLVRSLGADEVVDYTSEDFTLGGGRYDAIFDLVGNHAPSAYRRMLRSNGIGVVTTFMPGGALLGPLPYLLRVGFAGLRSGTLLTPLVPKPEPDDLIMLRKLIEAGDVSPVIEHVYGFSEIAAAIARQGEGHARGKAVVAIDS